MKKTLVTLAAVLGLFAGQPAYAGIGFGIPLPFPFLVWTPSGHSSPGHHGGSNARGQESTASSRHLDTNGAPVGTNHHANAERAIRSSVRRQTMAVPWSPNLPGLTPSPVPSRSFL
jgi:hypothetical protein